MITSVLMGGIGNQMFQYMMGLQQSHIHKTKLQLDTSKLGGARPFQLSQWRIPTNLCTPQKATIHEQSLRYNQATVDSVKDGDVLQGYWQSEKYFSNFERMEVRRMLRPVGLPSERAKALYNGLTEERAVAVHIRRGDYLLEPHKSFHGVLDAKYYNDAFNEVLKRVGYCKFFIFSDDPVWVGQHFTGKSITVVPPGEEAEDIHLMAHCQHIIIANSSFSWWGAWLGEWQKNRIVIAPKKWFTDEAKQDYSDIVPERWIKL